LADRLRVMCAHDRASTDALIEAMRGLEQVPQEVLDKMAHVIAAQHMWMHRFGLLSEQIDDIFPKGQTLEAISTRAHDIGTQRERYTEGLDDEACCRIVTYTATEGTQHTTMLADILLHLSLHGQYHRGQVARLLRDLSPEPVETDYISFVREDVPA
jgi:uncharacterized damage-inducible protein DinB